MCDVVVGWDWADQVEWCVCVCDGVDVVRLGRSEWMVCVMRKNWAAQMECDEVLRVGLVRSIGWCVRG